MPKFIVTRSSTTDFVVDTDDPDSQKAVKQVQDGKVAVSTRHNESYQVREMPVAVDRAALRAARVAARTGLPAEASVLRSTTKDESAKAGQPQS